MPCLPSRQHAHRWETSAARYRTAGHWLMSVTYNLVDLSHTGAKCSEAPLCIVVRNGPSLSVKASLNHTVPNPNKDPMRPLELPITARPLNRFAPSPTGIIQSP